MGIIVVGMHRSGTSALVGALRLLGFELGERLMPGRPEENDSGFYESLELFDLHQRILEAAASSWHDPRPIDEAWQRGAGARPFRRELGELLRRRFDGIEHWAVKDPRICRLLPLWLETLAELEVTPRVALIFRHPEEVAASLARRDNLSRGKSALLWLTHNLEVLRHSGTIPRAVVAYRKLVERPAPSLVEVGRELRVEWPREPGEAKAEIRDFVKPELRHHRSGSRGIAGFGSVTGTMRELYRHLSAAAGAEELEGGELERLGRRRDAALGDQLVWEHAGQLARDAARRSDDLQRVVDERTLWLQAVAGDVERQRERSAEGQRQVGELAASLEEARREAEERLGRLTGEVDRDLAGLRERMGSVDRQLRALDQKARESAEREEREGARQRSELASQRRELEGQRRSLEEQRGSLEEQRGSLEEQRRELEGQRGSLEEQRRELDGRQEELAADLESHRSRSEERHGELEAGLAELSEHRSRSEERSGRLAEEVAESRRLAAEQASTLEYLRDELRETGERHERELARDGRRLGEQARALERLQRRNDELSEELARQRSMLDALSGDVTHQRGELLRATSLLGRHERQVAEIAGQSAETGRLLGMLWTSRPWRLYVGVVQIGRRLVGLLPRFLRRSGDAAPSPEEDGGRAAVAEAAGSGATEGAAAGDFHALIVDHRLPTPDQDSGSLRMFNLVRLLQRLGFRVSFLPINLEPMEPYGERLRRRGVRVVTRPDTDSLLRHLERHGEEYDLAILSRVPVASECIDEVRALCPRARVLFDTVDLYHLREGRGAELEEDDDLRAAARRTKEMELAVAREADATLVVSGEEEEVLRREIPELTVGVVSNIHELPGRLTGFEERRDLMFIGGFEHPPNADGIRWFVESILPRIVQRLPGVHLYVVGSKPTDEVRMLGSERVTVTGYVPDVEPYYARCRLSVAPLRYGAGVKGKVNQSLSYGVPCVATTVAAEGMALANGVDVLIADDAEAFADAVVSAYTDAELWRRLSDGGLANIRRCFSFEAASDGLCEVLAAVGHPLAAPEPASPSAATAAEGSRLAVLFCQYDNGKYPRARERLIEIVERLPGDSRLVVADNKREGDWRRDEEGFLHIGGDNRAWEFSAFDRALELLDGEDAASDVCTLVTDAFGAYGEGYLDLVDGRVVELCRRYGACVGWVDGFGQECRIGDRRYEAWLRTSFLFAPRRVLDWLRPLAADLDGLRIFGSGPEQPFAEDADLSPNLQRLLLGWLTTNATDVRLPSGGWHSQFELDRESFPHFRSKVSAILREHLLSARLAAAGVPCYDFRCIRRLDEEGRLEAVLGGEEERRWRWLAWRQAATPRPVAARRPGRG